jgi:sulfonate transport system permease protein
LLAWEAGSRIGLIPERILAPPTAVAGAFRDMFVSGELTGNLAVSLARAAAGLTLGVLIGSSLALAAGLSRLGESLVDPLLQLKRTIPVVALTPLFIVWFGIGETPKVTLIAVATIFPIYLNLFAGIRGVDPKLIEAGRTLGLSNRELVAQVILPGALPSFLVGLRYALGVALVMLVVAEQVNASAGLGHLINDARDFMRTDVIVVCLLVYALLGLTGDLAVRALERAALAWRPSFLKS